jgi:hypothetical protein
VFILYWHSTAKYSLFCVEPLFSVVLILFSCVDVYMYFKLRHSVSIGDCLL